MLLKSEEVINSENDILIFLLLPFQQHKNKISL